MLEDTAAVPPQPIRLATRAKSRWTLCCVRYLQLAFQALGSFYFLHESLKNIYQFDFKAKKYKKVTGKEIYSDTLESTAMLEKAKFPQDYFPECKWSRKGFVRTRWCVADCTFDLVNIHLFHDASNLVAWETSPSVYSGIRHKALGYVLDRITDPRFEKAAYFIFGDFNFRLDSKSVVEVGTLAVAHPGACTTLSRAGQQTQGCGCRKGDGGKAATEGRPEKQQAGLRHSTTAPEPPRTTSLSRIWSPA
ncbi:hypothetical protein MC885_015537 [Smutsia gigantea]|nr:hypothetical protein MC885_015537 [Smutsia gigantea]